LIGERFPRVAIFLSWEMEKDVLRWVVEERKVIKRKGRQIWDKEEETVNFSGGPPSESKKKGVERNRVTKKFPGNAR